MDPSFSRLGVCHPHLRSVSPPPEVCSVSPTLEVSVCPHEVRVPAPQVCVTELPRSLSLCLRSVCVSSPPELCVVHHPGLCTPQPPAPELCVVPPRFCHLPEVCVTPRFF